MLPGYSPLPNTDTAHQAQHRQLFQFTWPLVHTVATTTPTTDTLPVGFAQVFDDGTTRRVYHNLNGVLYYWSLTAA